MNQISSIGVNPKDFINLLAARFYSQIVRPQFEYGLVINTFTSAQIIQLENTQKHCLRTIFGISLRSSINVVLYLVKLPTMKERINILQAQFLLRSLYLPDNSLLSHLLPHIKQHFGRPQWHKLPKQCYGSVVHG
jgi:hypothetical protein